jgi:O-antigen/teichoic acid export membrane protein
VVLLNILIKPVWLFLENDVQDKIGHKDFGLYTALFSLGYIFASLTDIGLNQYITKKLAADPSKLKEVFSNVFALKLLMLVFYPLFMAVVGYSLGYSTNEIYLLAVLSFAQALVQLLFFFRANFQANQFFMVDSTASVMDKFVLILMIVVMLSYNITLDTFIYARLASLIVTVLVFYVITIKLFDFIAPKFEPEKLKTLIRLSIPFALITILYSINEKIDSVMIERLSDAAREDDPGLYAAAYRWLDACMMYIWTIQPIFFAKFAFHIHEPKEKQRLLNFGQIVSSVPMAYVSAFVLFYGQLLFFQQKQSSPEAIATMTMTLQVLFTSAFLQGLFSTYSSLLTSTGYEKQVSVMILGSIIINIIGNFIFIPIYGPVASAWITVCSTLFMAGCYIYYTHFKLDIDVPYPIIIRLVLVYIAFLIVFYLLTLTPLPWYMVSMLAGACLLLFCYIAGILNIMINR